MYHTTTFSKIYSDSPPDLTLLGELKVQELILPEFKRTSGHSKKHQEHSQYKDTETEKRKYACHSCGGFEHKIKTCPKPSTECKFNKFGEAPLNLANKQTKL